MKEEIANYERLADVFKALGHPTRLGILMETIAGEFCVRDLERHLDRTQSNISQHLAVLRERGLVIPRRKGKAVCYRLANDRIADIISLATEAFDRPEAL